MYQFLMNYASNCTGALRALEAPTQTKIKLSSFYVYIFCSYVECPLESSFHIA